LPPVKFTNKGPAVIPKETWSAEVVKRGGAVYCVFCHDFSVISNGVARFAAFGDVG
jgi:hypothetical protein